MVARGLEIVPVEGVGEVRPGDDLSRLLAAAVPDLADGDVLVVTQKVVSKAEAQLVPIDPNDPESKNRIVEGESVRVLRRRGELVISETRHGFVCANAGVDLSNVGEGDVATLLPLDPDISASRLSDALGAPVIISDSFGRAWRNGIVNVAIGVAGLEALLDLRGQPDASGRIMQSTVVAVADELASAADLAGGKTAQRPVVLIRGYDWRPARGSGTSLVMEPERDLFP